MSAIQLDLNDDTSWNVMDSETAANYRAGGRRHAEAVEHGTVASVSGNFGAGGFIGMAGVSITGGPVVDTQGNACVYYSICLQGGLGMGVGLGGGAGLSVSEVAPGASTSHGPFGFGGSGLFGAGSMDFSGGGGVAIDYAGVGMGAAGGYQWCVQNNAMCN